MKDWGNIKKDTDQEVIDIEKAKNVIRNGL